MDQRTTATSTPRQPALLRSRPGIFAVAGGALVVILFLAVVLTKALAPTTPPPNAAERVAKQFYTTIQQQNYTAAWGMFADEQQAQLTQYAFTLFAKEQDTKYGPVIAFHEVRYDADRNHANQGVVQERVTRANHTQYLIGLTITQTADGTWKILEEDHAI